MPLSPPRPSTAPLNALRALEAAGRHGSFLRAAEELSVTPGAVAQHIKKLEEWSGAALFERHRHGVSLTPLGQQLMPQLGRGFEALGLASQALRHGAERPEIRIAALPAIAQLWLSPRLSALGHGFDAVDLAIHALDTPPLLGRGEFDLAIYPEDMIIEGANKSAVLSLNALTPVASPDVADSIRTPEDLKSATLIHDLAWNTDWRHWMAAQDGFEVEVKRGPSHSLYSIAVERCVAGDGILIGHTALIRDHLERGALQRVFPDRDLPWPAISLMQPADSAMNARVEEIVTALLQIA